MTENKERIVYASLLILFVVALFAVFAAPIVKGLPLLAPDTPLGSLPFYHNDGWNIMAGTWLPLELGEANPPGNVSPMFALRILLAPERYALWTYIVNVALLYLATLMFLRVIGVSTLAAMAGAIAMAFTGHTFTLVSAGHMGKSGLMPFAVLAFACLHLAITRRSLLWFALAGLAVGTGLGDSYDVMFMFCLLAAAYAVFLFIVSFRQKRTATAVGMHLLGAAVALAFTVGAALPALQFIFTDVIQGRQAMVGQSGDAHPDDENSGWEFATNWSLPPEEIVEFFVPAIYGYETGNTTAPYWGRTGQSADWDETHQGMRNLRQHGLYLGVIQMVLALLAVSCALRRAVPDDKRRYILFWGGAWCVTVLLALGRYGPLYWLFYKFIPYASSIRCPIKFMHLVELSTVTLFALGLDCLLANTGNIPKSKNDPNTARPPWRGFATLSFSMAGLMILGMAVASMQKDQLFARFASMGFTDSALPLQMHLIGELMRSAFVFAVLGNIFILLQHFREKPWSSKTPNLASPMAGGFAIFGALGVIFLRLFQRMRQGMREKTWASGALGLTIAALITVDMVTTDLPYVKTEDTKVWYEPNALVDRLTAEQAPFRICCTAGDSLSAQLNATTFQYFGIQRLIPPQSSSIEPRYKAFIKSVLRNPLRYWQLGNAEFIFGPRETLAQLMRYPAFQAVLGVGLVRGEDGRPQVTSGPADHAQYVLLRNTSALPRALLYHDWDAVDEKIAFDRLSSTNWNPAQTVLVEGLKESRTTGVKPDAVRITAYVPTRVEMETSSESDGVLLLNDRYGEGWEAQVNGKTSDTLRCNGIMRGVRVPSGQAHVVFIYNRPYFKSFVVKMICIAVALVWGLACLVLNQFRKPVA